MAKGLTLIWLIVCSLFCGAVLLFLWRVASRDSPFDLDWTIMLVGLAALGLPMAGAWAAFRRRWYWLAAPLGALPVGLVLIAVSQIRIRMF